MPRITAKEAVFVEGLDELRAGLKAIGPAAERELSKANKAAADIVAKAAQAKAESLGGVAAKSAPSVKSSAGAKQASVFLGSDQFPFALGAEFGAKKYHQFKPWRGNQWVESGDENVGYFLHPAIRDNVDELEAQYLDAVGELSKIAFPD